MKLRLGVIILSFLLTMLLLLGAWSGWRWSSTLRLENQLSSLPGVEQLELKLNRHGAQLHLTLQPDADVQRVLEEAEALVRQKNGKKELAFEVKDNPSAEMLQIWEANRFQIEEILATRHFSAFPAVAEEMGKQLTGSQVDIGINEKYLFFHWQKDDRQLIRVLPRKNEGEEG